MAVVSTSKKLTFFEICLSYLNVSAVLRLRGRISLQVIDKALGTTCAILPFLCLQLADNHLKPSRSSVVARAVPAAAPTDPQRRLEHLASLPRDPHALMLLVFVVDVGESSTEIYLVLNHAVCDGTSFFRICQVFLTCLGEAVVGVPHPNVAAHQLTDYMAMLPQDVAHDLPSMPASFLPPISAARGSTEAPERAVRGIWYGLDAALLQILRELGHKHNFTVQAALSAAAEVALVHAVGAVLPQTLLNLAPVDMRPHLPGCDLHSYGAASACLWWPQQLDGSATLATVAAGARAAIISELERKSGQGYLYRMVHKQAKQPPHASMATSLGVVPLQQSYQEGKLHLEDVQMLVGMYQAPPGYAILMTHAFTFASELRCVVEYSWPAIPTDLAARYAAAQEKVLHMLTKEPELTLATVLAKLG